MRDKTPWRFWPSPKPRAVSFSFFKAQSRSISLTTGLAFLPWFLQGHGLSLTRVRRVSQADCPLGSKLCRGREHISVSSVPAILVCPIRVCPTDGSETSWDIEIVKHVIQWRSLQRKPLFTSCFEMHSSQLLRNSNAAYPSLDCIIKHILYFFQINILCDSPYNLIKYVF